MIEDDKFIFFYDGIYSQWSSTPFYDIVGQPYTCAEQYMMACKAATFNDTESYEAIMATDMPNEQKAIGRKVKGFDKEVWEKDALTNVVAGNYFKFTQHEGLYNDLKASGNKVIVEASPTDKVWGIGMGEHDEGIDDPDNWDGSNWLGIAIMRVRLILFRQAPFDKKFLIP